MRILKLGLFLAIMGCSSVPEPIVPVRTTGSSPRIGVSTVARVGDEIYETFNYFELKNVQRANLRSGVKQRFGFFRIVAPANSALIGNSLGELCTVENVLIDPNVGPYQKVCFVDENGDGLMDKVGRQPGRIRFWHDVEPPVGVVVNDDSNIVWDAGGYKRELIFQGVDGATLRVRYREFKDSLARPAFSQDLTYPIVEGQSEIVFRDLQIHVTEIAATQIKYSIVNGSLSD